MRQEGGGASSHLCQKRGRKGFFFAPSLLMLYWDFWRVNGTFSKEQFIPLSPRTIVLQFLGNAADGLLLILSCNQRCIGSLNHHDILQANECNKML